MGFFKERAARVPLPAVDGHGGIDPSFVTVLPAPEVRVSREILRLFNVLFNPLGKSLWPASQLRRAFKSFGRYETSQSDLPQVGRQNIPWFVFTVLTIERCNALNPNANPVAVTLTSSAFALSNRDPVASESCLSRGLLLMNERPSFYHRTVLVPTLTVLHCKLVVEPRLRLHVV